MEIKEAKSFSQNGEDGVIASIFSEIGTKDKRFVEIGCGNGSECNTRALSETEGWSGVRIDRSHKSRSLNIHCHVVDVENICPLLRKLGVAPKFDLLSLDIDFNDFHVLRAILGKFQPRVIVVEYNASLGPVADCVVPYDPRGEWDGSDYGGASYTAFARLGEKFGYQIVYCDSMGVNLFMVFGHSPPSASFYMPPRYGVDGKGHGPDKKMRKYKTSAQYLERAA